MLSIQDKITSIRKTLSAPRLGRYEDKVRALGKDDLVALDLYVWNAQLSGALLAPLHITEIAIRNAVAEALSYTYGDRWPWSEGFLRSLPVIKSGYSALTDLNKACWKAETTGKVIPELNFVFWQAIFTKRHDKRLWRSYLLKVFPNLDQTQDIKDYRQSLYSDLGEIRMLRNRIAHHEPIFERDLQADWDRIVRLIEYRSRPTVDWMLDNSKSHVETLLENKPI